MKYVVVSSISGIYRVQQWQWLCICYKLPMDMRRFREVGTSVYM